MSTMPTFCVPTVCRLQRSHFSPSKHQTGIGRFRTVDGPGVCTTNLEPCRDDCLCLRFHLQQVLTNSFNKYVHSQLETRYRKCRGRRWRTSSPLTWPSPSPTDVVRQTQFSTRTFAWARYSFLRPLNAHCFRPCCVSFPCLTHTE